MTFLHLCLRTYGQNILVVRHEYSGLEAISRSTHSFVCARARDVSTGWANPPVPVTCHMKWSFSRAKGMFK